MGQIQIVIEKFFIDNNYSNEIIQSYVNVNIIVFQFLLFHTYGFHLHVIFSICAWEGQSFSFC